MEQRAQQAAQAGADHCALYSISYFQSSLSTGYSVYLVYFKSSVILVAPAVASLILKLDI